MFLTSYRGGLGGGEQALASQLRHRALAERARIGMAAAPQIAGAATSRSGFPLPASPRVRAEAAEPEARRVRGAKPRGVLVGVVDPKCPQD